VAYRRAARDEVLEVWAMGSALLRDGHTRLAAAAGLADYTGQATALDGSDVTVDALVAHLQLGAFGRFRERGRVGAGLSVYGGSEGDVPVGLWAGLSTFDVEPYRAVALRLHGHLLLEEPAAAPGLGGRTTGFRVEAGRDVGRRAWISGDLGYELLGLEPEGAGSVQDGRVSGSVTFGWRLLEGAAAVPEPLRLDTASLPGLAGSHLVPKGRREVSVWASYQGIRLLDGQDLARFVPLGEKFDYLLAGGRADLPLAAGMGAKVEGYAGVELNTSDPLFGVEAGLAWRPSHRAELSAVLGYGSALGRAGDEDTAFFRFAATVRW
jgi:hypothetical protein